MEKDGASNQESGKKGGRQVYNNLIPNPYIYYQQILEIIPKLG